jgi:hypothetical protein
VNEYRNKKNQCNSSCITSNTTPEEPFGKEFLSRIAEAKNVNEEREDHQKKIYDKYGEEPFASAKKELPLRMSDFQNAENFGQIHRIVANVVKEIKRLGVKGLGELYIYDTALRIGKHPDIKKEPKHVYLHAGTLEGAMDLLFPLKLEKKDFSDYPELAELSCGELEDFLCQYKHKLKKYNKY